MHTLFTKIAVAIIAISGIVGPGAGAGEDHIHAIKHREHAGLFELVRDDRATHVATRSGAWADRATWASDPPGEGARVVVPAGVTVAIASDLSATAAAWIRVDGVLRLATDRDTVLRVGTLVVTGQGAFVIGSRGDRVDARRTARLVFADRGERDRVNDPSDLTGGLIAMGAVRAYGCERSGIAVPAERLLAGTNAVTFDAIPTGWAVGDELLVPGVSPREIQDEIVRIERIDGARAEGRATVVFGPALRFDHAAPPGAAVPIGNLTRNVRFESERPDVIARRGHVMIMHQQTGIELDGVALNGLGRTRAQVAHTIPRVSPDGTLHPGSDSNTIGRYALHFHIRSGARRELPPHVVRNCVITDSPKHGLVNHGGHVLAGGNVTYDIDGSHFFTENGTEIGAFRHNMAVRSAGSGDKIVDRMYTYDFGHEGVGFWMQSGGIVVTDNYAFGHAGGAYVFFTGKMRESGKKPRFRSANLTDPAIAKGRPWVSTEDVPIRFARNTAAACASGFEVWYHKRNAEHDELSFVEDSTFWNMASEEAVVQIQYSRNVVVRGLTLIGDPDDPRGTGIITNVISRDIRCEGLTIVGFDEGIIVPRRGRNVITRCSLNNLRNIFVAEPFAERRTDINGVAFGVLPGSPPQHDVYLRDRQVKEVEDETGFMNLLAADVVTLNGRQVYFEAQRPDARPYDRIGVPELDGLTTAQMADRYGLARGGAVAPPEARRHPKIRGLIGPRVEVRSRPSLASRRFTNELASYVPRIREPDGTERRGEPSRLREGWNIVPVPPARDGAIRSVLVYGDRTPPEFVWHRHVTFQIHPDDVSYGWMVAGETRDRVGPAWNHVKLRKRLTNLKVDDDGMIRTEFSFEDRAGNVTTQAIELEVTRRAARRVNNIDAFEQASARVAKRKW